MTNNNTNMTNATNNDSIETLINDSFKSGNPTSVLQAIEVCKTLGVKFAPFVGGESDKHLHLVEELLREAVEVCWYTDRFGRYVASIKENPKFKAWEWDGYKEYRSISISAMLGWWPWIRE